MCAAPFPDYFREVTIFSKNRIAQQLEVMGCGGVAVEVERAGGFEDAAQFDEARGHRGEVGHHVVATQKGVEGLYHVGNFAGPLGHGVVGFLGLDVPMPGVLKGANLAGGVGAVLFMEEGVVVLGGVEGRVEINQVNRLVLDVTLENFEVVAVIKRAHARTIPVSWPAFNSRLEARIQG